MQNTRKITDDIFYLGVSSRRLNLFENTYPIPDGMSYNSYLIKDDKTVLLDTVDRTVGDLFIENLEYALDGRKLDYVVVNHMEPDHCALLAEIMLRYPELTLVLNTKTMGMIKQFFGMDVADKSIVVKEGDTLETGHHTLSFVMAPMVHWPEVMMTYDATAKILFAADAFGTFGALSGNIYADAIDFERDFVPEARRYYTNIVGKYGPQVMAVLKKAQTIDIQMICPLHGPIWRKDLGLILDKYAHWASYEPEEIGVVIAYASIYGHTENAAEILGAKLADKGVENIRIYDTSATHPSYILGECFRYSHMVFASSTYNNGLFPTMETLLSDICAHNLQNRHIALIENGTWAPQSGKIMTNTLSALKNTELLEGKVTLKSALNADSYAGIEALADIIAESVKAAKA